ncbi:hypothetical protein OAF93_01175 [Planctomycetota bacterium]|nr:hypothetical protein [Planctomycetota bacterium]MDB4736360.1 hypothetical protein [Planctomycetota bacterium]
MTRTQQFHDHHFTELAFQARHLSPLRRLYRQMLAGCLADEFSFRASPGLHANMTWQYATSPAALAEFEHCLSESDLGESLSIVDGDSRLLAACFVIVAGDTPIQDFHVDYGQSEIPAGVTGTMLTPLIAFDPPFGHLDCREGLREFEYRYQIGEAILFDGKFEHRPQLAGSIEGGARVLVSWSIATEDERYRFAIQRVIDSQMPT